MKINIGSLSEEKRNIVIKAFKEINIDVSIKSVEVDPQITDQPLDKKTTLKGATNRANNARKAQKDGDFWIGLEGGLHDYGEGYHLVTYATLIDKDGDEFVGSGEELHLPREVSEKVKKGEGFGEVICEYAKNNKIDENLITRISPFVSAVQNAYANYLKKKGNLSYRNKSSAIIFNKENKILLVQLLNYKENEWNVPGGGWEEGESAEQALKRELKEELGMESIEILEKSEVKNRYDFPDYGVVISMKKGRIFKGQQQTQFIVKFTGEDAEIKLQKDELRKYKWVSYEELRDYLVFAGQAENIETVIRSSKVVKL